MIALVTTFFLVFYILIPGALFRIAGSIFVRLKPFQRTRTQEATFAVSVALLPFALALSGAWYFPVMRHLPFPVQEGTNAERRIDYHRVADLLMSSDSSRYLACTNQAEPCASATAYWRSLDHVLRRQARFLSWFFLAIFLEGVGFGFLASRYGDWQRTSINEHNPLIRLYDNFTRKFILPNLSEWHILLTSFNWPRKEKALVVADVLQNDGNLYRGRVEDYFVDPEGKLTGVLLRDVDRFDRNAYRKAQELSEAHDPTAEVDSEYFWKLIPSENFYIGQGSISNLNLRFTSGEISTLISVANNVLQQEDLHADHLTVDPEDNPRSIDGPDLYS